MHTSPLRAISERCLIDLDEIATTYMREVRVLPGYAAVAVTDEELQHTARGSLNYLLRLLAEQPVHDHLATISDDIGRRRAKQGLALDSLLRAVRMDFPFLWNVLRSRASESELAVLGDYVETVWAVVELHTTRVQSSYIAELTAMRRDLEIERSSLLRRLLVEGVHDDAHIRHVAAAFSLPVSGRMRVLVASARFATEFRARLTALRIRTDVHAVDGTECIFLPADQVKTASTALLTLPAGISPEVNGIAELTDAWGIAVRLAQHVDSSGAAATVTTHWAKLAADSLGAAHAMLEREHLAALDALAPDRRDAIVTTVREYMRSGSINVTAERLYLHRNTMLKRLNRFTELTRLDPAIPDEAALITLVLARRSPASESRQESSATPRDY